MAIKPSSAKAKGRALQQWVAAAFSRVTGIPWGPEDEKEIQSRPMAQRGVDVILRGRAAELLPLSIECKNGESFQLVSTVEQARANTKPGTDWIIVHKRKKFRNPIVMMDWKTFEGFLIDRIVRLTSSESERTLPEGGSDGRSYEDNGGA